MKLVQSKKVKYAKSIYKENITSVINPYHLVGDVQGIKEDLWDGNKTCENYSLTSLCYRICLLMNKCGTLLGE